MEKATSKTKFSSQAILGIFVLALAGASVYLLPYLKWTYYDALLQAFNLDNTQLGVLMGIFGALSMIFYAPGGWMADRFSARKLLTISLAGTGVLGAWFATFPGFGAQVVIYAGWGVLTTLTFWASMVKACRGLGPSEQQGRLFGFLEGGRGVLSAVIAFATLALFTNLGQGVEGLRATIIAMVIICFVAAVCIWLFLKDPESSTVDEPAHQKASGKDIATVLKMPSLWLIAIVIICCYSVYVGSTFLTPYFTTVIGVTASVAAALAIVRTYIIQFVCGPTGGIIADKTHSISKTIIGCYLIMVVSLVAMLLLPADASVMIPVVVVMIVLCAGIFAMRGIYFATVDEVGVPFKVTGIAVGIVSVIGFLPDVFMNAIYGGFLDAAPGAAGYKMIFVTMLVFCIVGTIGAFLLHRNIEKQKALKAASAAEPAADKAAVQTATKADAKA